MRAQEVSRYVEHGFFDCGLTGLDWIQENGSDVVEVCDLIYSKASVAEVALGALRGRGLAGPKSPAGPRRQARCHRACPDREALLRGEEDPGRRRVLLGSDRGEGPRPGRRDRRHHGDRLSLRANKLRIVDTLLETNTKLIANKKAWADPAKRRKIETIALLVRGAPSRPSRKVGLKMNAPKKALAAIIKAVPSLRNPTISPLSNPDWVALETIIDESVVREILPQLKALGAEGIVEYPLNKVVY